MLGQNYLVSTDQLSLLRLVELSIYINLSAQTNSVFLIPSTARAASSGSSDDVPMLDCMVALPRATLLPDIDANIKG